MTIPLDHTLVDSGVATGAAGPGDGSGEMDYRTIDAAGSGGEIRPLIHIQLDALDGIARDVIEGFKALPRRGIEVGGLLLGRVDPAMPQSGPSASTQRPQIWVERFQRIPCEHRFGPQYVLDREDQIRLEEAAGRITESGDLMVLGAYRSHTRPGFQTEESDREFVDRYFRDPSDLILLIKPESLVELRGQFFLRNSSGTLDAAGAAFPFQGRMLGMFTALEEDEAPTGKSSAGERARVAQPLGFVEPVHTETAYHDVKEAPGATVVENVPEMPLSGQESVHFRASRLVPDFVPAGDSPNPRPLFRTLEHMREEKPPEHEDIEETSFLRKWWPLLCALALVSGALAILFWPARGIGILGSRGTPGSSTVPAPANAETFRPLGLYVDPSGPEWRITWNQTATPLVDARAVGLFVREGEDQNRIDLSPADLKSGTYQYKPKGNDVTFRLEVTDSSGRVSGESFRLIRAGTKSAAVDSHRAGQEKPIAENPAPTSTHPNTTQSIAPKAIRRVPPVVPASIRPRIRGSIPIDIRVRVDTRGRVVSATPVRKATGLEAFLAGRAIEASRQWRFTPAKQDGRAVAGTQTIHFVFDRQ